MDNSFFNSDLFGSILMPCFIFFARICDVSFGTMRIIFVSKGKRNIAPFFGFFEVLIWIIAISKIMQNLDNYVNYVAYAAGFATGNYVGMRIEEKLAMGILMIRIFTNEKAAELVHSLSLKGFGATVVEAHGAREKTHIIYSIVQRNDLEGILEIVNNFNPKAFYTIEDIKVANEGISLNRKVDPRFPFSHIIRRWRKGK
jgi:uncharacterized protein YebE (UPF0316 family)